LSQATHHHGTSTATRRRVAARAIVLVLACLSAAILLPWASGAPSSRLRAVATPGHVAHAPGEDGGIPVQDGRATDIAKSRRLPFAPSVHAPSSTGPAAIRPHRMLASRDDALDLTPRVPVREPIRPAGAPRLSLPPSQAPPAA